MPDKPKHHNFKDLEGKSFGRLIVTSYAGRLKNRTYWNAICDCGNERKFAAGNLSNGSTKSCGCLQRELTASRSSTHGESRKTREYKIWGGMIQRCDNSNSKAFRHYGGRGISVCRRWKKYENFLADMSRSPSPEHSLDRINNNGNYEPENCRWATWNEQARNRKTNKLLEYNGKSQCLAAWAEELGINYGTLNGRLKRGMTVERAFTQPVADCCDYLVQKYGLKTKGS